VEGGEIFTKGLRCLKAREIVHEAGFVEVGYNSLQALGTFRMVLFHLMLMADGVGNEGNHRFDTPQSAL
tara:strand:- start:501 stop:707 length:207 start_codon:yes stop_codon:yes gene_type:complete